MALFERDEAKRILEAWLMNASTERMNHIIKYLEL